MKTADVGQQRVAARLLRRRMPAKLPELEGIMRRKRTMLEKSISMNMEISMDYASKAIGWGFFAFLVLGLLSIPALIAVAVYAFLTFRQLFDKSLYGEEAYTYMMTPISMKYNIIGKVVVMCFLITLCYILAYIAVCVSALLFQSTYLDWSVGASLLQNTSGVFDAVENGVIGKDEIIYDRGALMHLAVNIVLSPIVILADGIFACGLFQLGFAVRHVLAPNRDKPVVTAMVAFAGIAVLCLVTAAFWKIDSAIFGDAVTVWSSLLEMIVFTVCGIGLLAVGIRLLERKYSLC